MAQIVQAGFQQISGPYDNLGGYAAQSAAQGVQRGFERADKQKLDAFNILNAELERKYPASSGGLTAALNSGDPRLVASATRDIAAYVQTKATLTGQRVSPGDVQNAIAGYASGMLTPVQEVERARALAIEQGMQGPQQTSVPPAGVVAPDAIPAAETSGTGVLNVRQGAGGETQATPAPAQVPPRVPSEYSLRGPGPVPAATVAPPSEAQTQYAGVPFQAAAASPASVNPYLERRFAPASSQGVQGTYVGKTYTPDEQEANRQAVLSAITGGIFKTDAQKAAEAAKFQQQAAERGLTPQVVQEGAKPVQVLASDIKMLKQMGPKAADFVSWTEQHGNPDRAAQLRAAIRSIEGAAEGAGANSFKVQAPMEGSQFVDTMTKGPVSAVPNTASWQNPIEAIAKNAKAIADQTAPQTPDGGRQIPLGDGQAIQLDVKELNRASQVATPVAKLATAVANARTPEELAKTASAFDKTATMALQATPGYRNFDQAWATKTVDWIKNASPKDLAAFGLNTEAQIALEDKKNSLLAEQSSNQLKSVLMKSSVDIAGFELQKRVSDLEYLGTVMKASSTQAGAAVGAIMPLIIEMYKMSGDKNFNVQKTLEALKTQGITNIYDLVIGGLGGRGTVLTSTPSWWPFAAPKLGVREATPSEAGGLAGKTPAAAVGASAVGGVQTSPIPEMAQEYQRRASSVADFDINAAIREAYKSLSKLGE